MYPFTSLMVFTAVAAVALGGCTAAENKPAVQASLATLAGWYMQHAGQGTFMPCGQSTSWRVAESTELRAKAKSFGLEDDTPVYVRLTAAQLPSGDNGQIKVVRVDQFGSTTPVRDCALNGVVLPNLPASGD